MLVRRLGDTDDLRVMCMVWAAHALQGRRHHFAKKFLQYPLEAVDPGLGSPYAVHPWDLETLLTVDINAPKLSSAPWRRLPFDTSQFSEVAEIINLVRSAEDHDSAGRLGPHNILLELHRIAHRQFAWQRGWVTAPDIYRHMYIYGHGLCDEYFTATYGLSIVDFVSVAIIVYSILVRGPWTPSFSGFDQIGIGNNEVKLALEMLSEEIWSLRRNSLKLLRQFETSFGGTLPLHYQPSYLRRKPVLKTYSLGPEPKYIAPLPELVVLRATVGVYYDLASGGTTVMNHATARFEEYTRETIKAHCPGFDPRPAQQYKYKKNPIDTPDILLHHREQIVSVFECKATKLTFEAQYAEDPIQSAKKGYDQIAKAIFQLWRFFSHLRRGIINLPVSEDATAIVLTLEPWTLMSGELRTSLIAAAEQLVADREPEINEEDKRHPVFCPIQELDEILAISSEAQLLQTFRTATEPTYHGWGIREIRRDALPKAPERKAYPFDLRDFFPWWKVAEDLLKVAPNAASAYVRTAGQRDS